MKAAVLDQAKQPMVIKDVPDPSVGADDVLIKVTACGVCHTDLHIVEGLLAAHGIDPFPLIMGHEIVGEVQGYRVVRVRAGFFSPVRAAVRLYDLGGS